MIMCAVVEYQTQAKELTNSKVTVTLLKDDQKKLEEELARLKGLCECVHACVCACVHPCVPTVCYIYSKNIQYRKSGCLLGLSAAFQQPNA